MRSPKQQQQQQQQQQQLIESGRKAVKHQLLHRYTLYPELLWRNSQQRQRAVFLFATSLIHHVITFLPTYDDGHQVQFMCFKNCFGKTPIFHDISRRMAYGQNLE